MVSSCLPTGLPRVLRLQRSHGLVWRADFDGGRYFCQAWTAWRKLIPTSPASHRPKTTARLHAKGHRHARSSYRYRCPVEHLGTSLKVSCFCSFGSVAHLPEWSNEGFFRPGYDQLVQPTTLHHLTSVSLCEATFASGETGLQERLHLWLAASGIQCAVLVTGQQQGRLLMWGESC